MARTFTISPFTPLFFIDRKADGVACGYIQTFAPTDKILVEVIETGFTPDSLLVTPPVAFLASEDNDRFDKVSWNLWEMNPTTRIWFVVLSPNPGIYVLRIDGIGESQPFRVTDNELELATTTLIQYSSKSNRYRKDVVFFIDLMQYFFDWRVPGGFKDSGWSFSAESDQFMTPLSDIIQLSGMEAVQKTFTLGNQQGVPIWFGEMLNRILTCTHVYFDGRKYCRKDTSVPEVTQQLEGINGFVFTQTLQQSNNLDPEIEQRNQAIMRRIGATEYRNVSPQNRLVY